MESFRQPSLFQDGIGEVARRDVAVHWKIPLAMRAEPNFMVALTLADHMAAVIPKDFFEFASEVPGH